MRIKHLTVPESVSKEFGLYRVDMKGLDNVVILAGKNGSGKTRILNIVQNNQILIRDFDQMEKQRRYDNSKNIRKALTQISLSLAEYSDKKILTSDQDKDLRFLSLKKAELEKDIAEVEKELKIENLIMEDELPLGDVFEFVPKKIEIRDSGSFTVKELKDLVFSTKRYNVHDFAEVTYGIIQALQDFAIGNAGIKVGYGMDSDVVNEIIKRYESLQELITRFLNTSLERNIRGEALIFGKPLIGAGLSEGQKILMQLCVALVEKDIDIENAIVILDEPENHLHPKILCDFIDSLLTVNKQGQIWIATHSIPLISHFDPHFLWHCDQGRVEYAGRDPGKVIDSLIGDNEKIKLTEFMNLPAQFASTRYATECLIPSKILDTSPRDPQTNQIKRVINELATTRGILRILDFGAGKGRLLKLYNMEDEELEKSRPYKFDYFAYDLPDVSQETYQSCLEEIEKYYKKDKTKLKRYFASLNDMSYLEEKSFDIIVLCNVLHEIDPKDWMSLFSTNNFLGKYLSSNGYLLIVEDQEMPVGEKAYKNGFMVFSENQFRKLFAMKEYETYLIDDSRKDGRLLAHLIPKSFIKRVTTETIKNSINNLCEMALTKITEIRNATNCDFKNGKKLSFWLQQYANASLNLKNF